MIITADKPFVVTRARLGVQKVSPSTLTIVGISNRHRSEFKKPEKNKSTSAANAKDPHKNKTFKECVLTVNIWENVMNWITIDINPAYLGQTTILPGNKITTSVLWFERDSCYRDYSKRFYISREVIRFIEINLLKTGLKKNILFIHFILKKLGLLPEIIMSILDLLY